MNGERRKVLKGVTQALLGLEEALTEVRDRIVDSPNLPDVQEDFAPLTRPVIEALETLNGVSRDERSVYDNLPGPLKKGSRGTDAEDAMTHLSKATTELDDLVAGPLQDIQRLKGRNRNQALSVLNDFLVSHVPSLKAIVAEIDLAQS